MKNHQVFQKLTVDPFIGNKTFIARLVSSLCALGRHTTSRWLLLLAFQFGSFVRSDDSDKPIETTDDKFGTGVVLVVAPTDRLEDDLGVVVWGYGRHIRLYFTDEFV